MKKEQPKYFEHIFPSSQVIQSSFNSLTDEAEEYLNNEKEYYPFGDFNLVWSITHPEDKRIDFAAAIHRPKSAVKDPGTGVYVLNSDLEGRLLGHTHSFLLTTSDGKPIANYQPKVSYTKTRETHLRLGLGTTRLLLLNYFCLVLFNTPLQSDLLKQPATANMWEKLYKLGLAEILVAGNSPQTTLYQFKKW